MVCVVSVPDHFLGYFLVNLGDIAPHGTLKYFLIWQLINLAIKYRKGQPEPLFYLGTIRIEVSFLAILRVCTLIF